MLYKWPCSYIKGISIFLHYFMFWYVCAKFRNDYHLPIAVFSSGEPSFVGRTEGNVTASSFPRRPRCVRVCATTSGDQQLGGRMWLWAPAASYPVYTSSRKGWLSVIRLHRQSLEEPDHIVMVEINGDLHRICSLDWQTDAFFHFSGHNEFWRMDFGWPVVKVFVHLPYLEIKWRFLAGCS